MTQESIDFCFARDQNNHYRRLHKPVAGMYDGNPITTCAWCGVTLENQAGDRE